MIISFSSCALDYNDLTDFFRGLWRERRRRNELEQISIVSPVNRRITHPFWRAEVLIVDDTPMKGVRESWLVPVCTVDRITPNAGLQGNSHGRYAKLVMGPLE